jgi:hypothetical protein
MLSKAQAAERQVLILKSNFRVLKALNLFLFILFFLEPAVRLFFGIFFECFWARRSA